jgi:hypothetical protein
MKSKRIYLKALHVPVIELYYSLLPLNKILWQFIHQKLKPLQHFEIVKRKENIQLTKMLTQRSILVTEAESLSAGQ